MGLVKPSYIIITPEFSGSFDAQWKNCLKQLSNNFNNKNVSLIRINIFVFSKNQADYLKQHNLIDKTIKDVFKDSCPPFGVVMQAPEDPYDVICEIGYVDNSIAEVKYGVFKNRPYCIVDAENYKEYWTIGAQSVHPDYKILASSEAAFNYLFELYQHLGLSFNNIVRQWNYVGEILSIENENGRKRQHYQMFNETRSTFYGKYRSRNDFPSATGIGMKYLGVCIDSFAVSGSENLKIFPISNPVQNESYNYEQNVLIGAPKPSLNQNQAPQFERAKLICLKKAARLLISGTASIIGQETIGLNDVEKQTEITIENIKRLSSTENLKKHYPEIKLIPNVYSYVRVYVKFKEDIAKVRSICNKEFGNAPATYVVADICRDNLLVEIETELVS